MITKIKPVFKCPDYFKDKFIHSKCLLTISVGQEVHEGEKFFATVDLINSSFKEVIILIDDTLQRHTMKIHSPLSIDQLYKISFEAGDQWLERNYKYYNHFAIPYKIIRWDHWLNHFFFLSIRNY